MDTLIVVLADRLPVPRWYDADHYNCIQSGQKWTHIHFTHLQFVTLTEIIYVVLNHFFLTQIHSLINT